MDWLAIVNLVKEYSLTVRVQAKTFPSSEDWSEFLFIPVPGYIESKIGPLSERDIAWVEINPERIVHRGRLVPDLSIDYSERISSTLNTLRIPYEIRQNNFRIVNDC